jgi:hypothetical protein
MWPRLKCASWGKREADHEPASRRRKGNSLSPQIVCAKLKYVDNHRWTQMDTNMGAAERGLEAYSTNFLRNDRSCGDLPESR